MKEHTFNGHGICTDPDVYARKGKGQAVEVRTAHINGRWGYGLGVQDNHGGGFSWGVNANNLPYGSQTEARETESPKGFTLRDSEGNTVGFVFDKSTANVFAHVPELLEMLDSCVEVNLPFAYSDAVELQEKLKPFRK